MTPPSSQEPPGRSSGESLDESIDAFEHPRGTLVIVSIFGLLFALGWIAMYVFVFLGRGALHP